MPVNCSEEALLKLINYLPLVISQKQSENIVQIPNVEQSVTSKLISNVLWGILPLLVGLLLFVCFLVYLCWPKKRKKYTKFRLPIFLIILLGIGAAEIYGIVLVLKIQKQFDRTQNMYKSIVDDVDEVLTNYDSITLAISSLIPQFKQKVTNLSNSSTYQSLISKTHNDFIKDIIGKINSMDSFLANVSLNQYNIKKYESYRTTANIYFHKYIIPSLLGLYSVSAGFVLTIAFLFYLKAKLTVKISFSGILIFLCIISLILTVFIFAVPNSLTVLCPQIVPIITQMNISFLTGIVSCDPAKPNSIFTDISNINVSSRIPSVNENCSSYVMIPTIYPNCLNVTGDLKKLRTKFVADSKLQIAILRQTLAILFECDRLPSQINKTKCFLCTKFIKSFFILGLVSSLASIAFLLFAFQIPTLATFQKPLILTEIL